jgi:hypothetical protein
MTADQETYIYNLQTAMLDYVLIHVSKLNKNRNRFLSSTCRIILLQAYYDMIYEYLSTDITGDTNFCSSAELEVAMRKINDILKSNYWVTL